MIFLTYITAIDSATGTITVASMPSQYQFLRAINVLQMSANRHLQGADGDTLKTLSDQIDGTASASDLATVDGIVDDLLAVAPDNKPTVAVSGEASANVTMWAGDAVAGAPALEATAQAILEDTGTTLPGLIAGVGAGSGTGYYSDILESPLGTPVDGARVTLTTDDDGENVAYEARTDAFGVFEMRPDPGTYYRFIEAASHTFAQGVEVEVTEP